MSDELEATGLVIGPDENEIEVSLEIIEELIEGLWTTRKPGNTYLAGKMQYGKLMGGLLVARDLLNQALEKENNK